MMNTLFFSSLAATTADVTAAEGGFHPENFVDNLTYMGYGMLGIFVVIGVIVGITYLLNNIFKKK